MFWLKSFTLNGDGTDFDLNVDGSVTPQVFACGCDLKETVRVMTLELVGVDGNIGADTFFGNAALTNGLKLQQHDIKGNVVQDLLTAGDGQNLIEGATIKTTADFLRVFASDFTLGAAFHALDDLLILHAHSYEVSPSTPLANLLPHQYLSITVQDDLTGITKLWAKAAGNRRPSL